MKEHTNLNAQTRKDNHTITRVLGTEAEVDDHDLHRQGTTIDHDSEKAEDPNLQGTHTTTTMKKMRWERHALLVEFAGCQ
jgi:hypothetical protein